MLKRNIQVSSPVRHTMHTHRRLFNRVPALGAALILSVTGTVEAAHASAGKATANRAGHPVLKIAVSPNASPRVVGRGWPAGTRITVTVRFFSSKASKRLRTSRTGTFGLAIDGAQWCRQLTVTARDAAGHTATVRGPNPFSLCSVSAASAKIAFHLLSAKEMQTKQITIDATKPDASITVHVGDVVYAYEPGTGTPALLLQSDPDFLVLIEQGTISDCPPTASCPIPPGHFWRYTARQVGDTSLIVSHVCRQSKPPCMLPDRVIRVSILA